ncbi:hypothetical protein Pfo_015185 [Paulownia fortunei]|nr:hypothetical protein Pfo_015185 [Paulownia fortunei]
MPGYKLAGQVVEVLIASLVIHNAACKSKYDRIRFINLCNLTDDFESVTRPSLSQHYAINMSTDDII